VEGAAHYLPAYAGNLDIMTSAALAAAEAIAARQTASGQGAVDDTFAGIQ
jgi:acetaldehyde dehydrogenase